MNENQGIWTDTKRLFYTAPMHEAILMMSKAPIAIRIIEVWIAIGVLLLGEVEDD